MRRCPTCGRAPRAHDPMYQAQNCGEPIMVGAGWPMGGYAVCWDCYRLVNPNTPPLPPPVIRDSGDIFSTQQDHINRFLCACCHDYAREDDPIAELATCLRILQQDIDAHPTLRPKPKPGALRICQLCMATWAPIVAERWRRDGIIAQGVTWQMLGFNMV